jgi:S1-C subfamily serine protease/thioredoxin-related protein
VTIPAENAREDNFEPFGSTPHGPGVGEEEDLFSSIFSEPKKPSAASVANTEPSPSHLPTKCNRNNRLVWFACGSVVAAMLIALGIMQVSGAFDRAPAVVEPPSASGAPMLIVEWPKEERGVSYLILDDTTYAVADQVGALEYKLTPGEHKLHLRRLGMAPIDIVVPSQKDGQRFTYQPAWKPGTPADDAAIAALAAQGSNPVDAPKAADLPVAESLRELKNWPTDLDAAKKEAHQGNKDLLLVFFGADRRDWCLKLAKEVLLRTDFRKFADPRFTFVLFEAKGPTFDDGSVAAKLVADYHISGYPTMVLADAEGLPYAQQEYMDPATSKYVARFQEALTLRKERDEVLIPTTTGSDDEKLAAAEKSLEWLSKHDLLRLFGPKIHEWIELAERVDPHNDQGRNETIFLTDWDIRLDDATKQGREQINAVAESLEAWKTTHKFKDPNFAAKTHLKLAAMLFQTGDQEGAGRFIQEALDCGPSDERLRRRLEMIVGRSNSPISSGSGFVIADGGLILTNNHVIEGPGRVWVRITGEDKEAKATVVAADPKHDVALVKLDEIPKSPLKPLAVSSITPGPGAEIAVFGYPLGDVLGGGVKFTAGAISAPPDKGRGGMYLLNCTVNHGNSGGPMCDKRGQVIGLVSAKTTVGDADSYGMALPPNTMADFLKAHIPNFKTAPATGDKKLGGWDEVYAQVSPSVVMILKRTQ